MRRKVASQASKPTCKSRLGWGIVWILVISTVISIILLTVKYLENPNHLPIQEVKIEGDLPHVTATELTTIIDPYVKKGFINLRVGALQQALLQHPWIKAVFIQRWWPDTLLIRLQEQIPLAYWGQNQLISDEGIVFTPSSLPPDLFTIEAPEGMEQQVMALYEQITNLLKPLGLKIHKLQLTPRGACELEVDNHLVIRLGRQDSIYRLQRLSNVYQKIVYLRHNDVKIIDLRYPNGIVVQ